MKKLSLQDIIEARAKELDADGICNPDAECGCSLEHMCCSEPYFSDCCLAKKKICPPKKTIKTHLGGFYLACPDHDAGNCDCYDPSSVNAFYFPIDTEEAGR